MQAAQLPEPAAVPVQRPASPALAPALRTISGETPHYRARFEVAAADGAAAAEAVKEIVMGWLHAKGLDVPEGAADIAVPAGWTAADEPDAAKAVRFLGLSGAQGAAWAVEAEAWEEIATGQERSYSDATAKVDELTRTVQRLEGEKRALERKAAQCAAPSEDDGAARVAECLQAIPRDLTDLLKLARSLWPNRIVVLPEAMDSAKSYDGNLAEEWDIVRGAATALYGLLFEDDGCEGQVADEFQRRTGYELTFSESSATRARVDLMKMRERSYCGRTVDISAHIKGRSQKNSFRLHFYIDRENELIVRGHAGCHMKTAGSQRRDFK